MNREIEIITNNDLKQDWKTQYLKFRTGRLKHQYWLKNRKNKNVAIIDEYDNKVIKNCKAGDTVIYGSAGYYLKDIFTDMSIHVIESHEVVKTFYNDVYIIKDRKKLSTLFPNYADNFAVINNRSDHWVTKDGLTEHVNNYSKIFNKGCRFFYSIRDTQIQFNRLTNDIEDYFLTWATSLQHSHDLSIVWHEILLPRRKPSGDGSYDLSENPDTTNGNIKFWFSYKEDPWKIVI